LTAAYASDILDRVTNITYRTAGGGLVRSFAYSYDAAGLITQKVTEAAGGQTVTNANAYDGLGRLVSESFTQSGTNALTHFSYDLAGNRLSVSSEFSVVNNTYTHNRLTAVSDGTSLAYDTAGNVTNIVSAFSAPSARKLTWNAQRQLVSVSTNGVFAESYAYDAIGRRISTTDSGGTVFHIYDGDECVADVDADGNPLRSYVWGQGIDNLLAMTVHPAVTNLCPQFTAYDLPFTLYAVKDHLGSVHALVDASGAVAESYTYDAWGNVSVLTSDLRPLTFSQFGNRYLFQGREYSYATGLYFFRARWYSPEFGRWLSNDPIGISGGLNLYVFCGNDPVNGVDPWGLWYIDINVSGGFFGGVTAGLMCNGSGLYPYFGGGLVTPGAGASITVSPSTPSSGWNIGLQGQGGVAGQVGYSFGEDCGGWFWEGGGGWPPGASLTGYYVWGPFLGSKPKVPDLK